MTPDLGAAVAQLAASPEDPQLLSRCQAFLDGLPVPCDVASSLAQLRHCRAPVLRLLEAELLLYFAAGALDTARLDAVFGDLAPLSMNNSLSPGSASRDARIKYHDLLTDYHYLLSPKVKGVRLMDLVAKKINALAPATEKNAVVDRVQFKVLVYHLLSDSDYRHRSVARYLADEAVADRLAAAPIRAYMARGAALVPLDAFHDLVRYVGSTFYPFTRVLQTHADHFVENFLDANVSKLPRYYESISLSRMRRLLLGAAGNRDLEALVFSMICANKFPHGAWIDQLAGMVHFGDKPEKHSSFTAHVQKVCEVVDTIGLAPARQS